MLLIATVEHSIIVHYFSIYITIIHNVYLNYYTFDPNSLKYKILQYEHSGKSTVNLEDKNIPTYIFPMEKSKRKKYNNKKKKITMIAGTKNERFVTAIQFRCVN